MPCRVGQVIIEAADRHLNHAPPDIADFVPGDHVALGVSDTGTGTRKEVRKWTLDSFFTTKPAGTGNGAWPIDDFWVCPPIFRLSDDREPAGRGRDHHDFMPRTEEET